MYSFTSSAPSSSWPSLRPAAHPLSRPGSMTASRWRPSWTARNRRLAGTAGHRVRPIGHGRPMPGLALRHEPDQVPWVTRHRASSARPPRGDFTVVLRGGEQRLRRIVESLDPVGAARPRHMAVAIDQARHERRTGTVHHRRVTRVLLPAGRTNPLDGSVRHEDADIALQGQRPAVGQGATGIDNTAVRMPQLIIDRCGPGERP